MSMDRIDRLLPWNFLNYCMCCKGLDPNVRVNGTEIVVGHDIIIFYHAHKIPFCVVVYLCQSISNVNDLDNVSLKLIFQKGIRNWSMLERVCIADEECFVKNNSYALLAPLCTHHSCVQSESPPPPPQSLSLPVHHPPSPFSHNITLSVTHHPSHPAPLPSQSPTLSDLLSPCHPPSHCLTLPATPRTLPASMRQQG